MPVPTVIGTPTASALATSITVTMPAGAAAGDLGLIWVFTEAQALLTTTAQAPKFIAASDSGWTGFTGNPYTTGAHYNCYLFWRVLDGTTGLNIPQTSDSGTLQASVMVVVRNALNTANPPFEQAAGSNGTTSAGNAATLVAITTTGAQDLVMGVFALVKSSTTQGWGATWTDASLANPASTGIVGSAVATSSGVSTGGYYGGKAVAGSSGAPTNTTVSAPSAIWQGITIGILAGLNASVIDVINSSDRPTVTAPYTPSRVTDTPTVSIASGTIPTINVSDATTVSDTPTVAPDPWLGVVDVINWSELVLGDVYAPIGTAETITVSGLVQADLNVSVSDATSTSDAPTLALAAPPGALNASTSDATSTAETPTIAVGAPPGALNVSTSDTIASSDTPTVTCPVPPTPSIVTSDATSTSDTPTLALSAAPGLNVGPSEAIGGADSPTLVLAAPPGALSVSTSDATSGSEAPTVVLPTLGALNVSVSDATSLADSPTLALIVNVSVADATATSEVPTVTVAAAPGALSPAPASDATTTSEAPTVSLAAPPAGLTPSVSDAIVGSETVIVGTGSTINIPISDLTTVADVPTVQIPATGALNVNVSDTSAHTEAPGASIALGVALGDVIGSSDTPTTSLSTPATLLASASDATTGAETPTVSVGAAPGALNVVVSDAISHTEVLGAGLSIAIGVSEATTHTETPTVALGVAGATNIVVSDATATSDTPTVSEAAAPGALSVSRSDASSVVATATVIVPDLYVVCSEASTLSDTPTMSVSAAPPALSFVVSDATAVSGTLSINSVVAPIHVGEVITVSVPLATRSISVTDYVYLYPGGVAPAGNINVTDHVYLYPGGIAPSGNVSVSEATSLSEWVVAGFPPEITALTISPALIDTIATSENVSVLLPALVPSVTQGVSVSEAPSLNIGASPGTLSVSRSDATSVSGQIDVRSARIALSETVGTQEVLLLTQVTALQRIIAVLDVVNAVDSPRVRLGVLFVSVAEHTSLSERSSVQPGPSPLHLTQTITTSGATTQTLTTPPQRYIQSAQSVLWADGWIERVQPPVMPVLHAQEAPQVGEAPTVGLDMSVRVTEHIAHTESTSRTLTQPPTLTTTAHDTTTHTEAPQATVSVPPSLSRAVSSATQVHETTRETLTSFVARGDSTVLSESVSLLVITDDFIAVTQPVSVLDTPSIRKLKHRYHPIKGSVSMQVDSATVTVSQPSGTTSISGENDDATVIHE